MAQPAPEPGRAFWNKARFVGVVIGLGSRALGEQHVVIFKLDVVVLDDTRAIASHRIER